MSTGASRSGAAASPWVAHLERYQAALLVVLPVVWGVLVFSPTFFTDPDSYMHVGVARRMLEQGWLSTFEWLPHTTLHDPFPDMYLGQHLLLAPLVAVLDVDTAMRVGILLFSGAFAVSLHLVLRRHGVRWAAPWVVLGLLACPLALTYSVFLKGATTFLVLLPWFVDAVWAGRPRRVFVLAWLSVYVYVGAAVLLGFVLAHALVARAWRGRWEPALIAATVAGLLAGMLLNPWWPAHWEYVARELATIFERDPLLVPGDLRGGEWLVLTGDLLVKICGAALVAWGVVLMRQLHRAAPVSVAAASGTLAALGLFGLGLLSGTKLIELFIVFSILTVPLLATQMAPWSRAAVALAGAAGLVASAWSLSTVHAELSAPGAARPQDYRVMAEWIDARAARQEMVLAPWDDMPGLFMFGGDQRYMAGFNVQFLRDHDPQRFHAYVFFYRGSIVDPEAAMARFFDGARLALVKRDSARPGDVALTARLAGSERFEELASPSRMWRVFRRHADAAAP